MNYLLDRPVQVPLQLAIDLDFLCHYLRNRLHGLSLLSLLLIHKLVFCWDQRKIAVRYFLLLQHESDESNDCHFHIHNFSTMSRFLLLNWELRCSIYHFTMPNLSLVRFTPLFHRTWTINHVDWHQLRMEKKRCVLSFEEFTIIFSFGSIHLAC
jgi:hypothetical protein